MKFIVCGAGQVGFNIARYLAAGDNDITIVEQSPTLAQEISDTLDVRAFVGMERSALHRKLKSLGVQGAERQKAGS